MTRRLTQQEFIDRATVLHQGKYQYQKVAYATTKIKVEIFCTVHQSYWWQDPCCHLKGQGCPLCAADASSERNTFPVEAFLSEAHKVHGGRFQYDLSAYVNMTTKIRITCKTCGESYMQKPFNHIHSDGGCVRCFYQSVTFTTESFIQKAKIKHLDRYCYDLVRYVTSKEKIDIICHQHGKFSILPSDHLKGSGCPKCGRLSMVKNRPHNSKTGKKSTDHFVRLAVKRHGDKYDYSKADYQGVDVKVKIICKKHNSIFEQSPTNHTRLGNGCPKCGKESMASKTRVAAREFMERAKLLNGDLYSYSLDGYKDTKSKIIVTCKKHGNFTQSANRHLAGDGCLKCGQDAAFSKTRLTTNEFVEKARLVHKDDFKYDLVDYRGSYKKVTIICNKCNKSFSQIPHNHLTGAGCPHCAKSFGEDLISGALDALNVRYATQAKFPTCKLKRVLRFDFCTFFGESKILIEYDGIHHYEIIDTFGGEEGFEYVKLRDNIKNKWARENGIPLIRIDYTHAGLSVDEMKAILLERFSDLGVTFG